MLLKASQVHMRSFKTIYLHMRFNMFGTHPGFSYQKKYIFGLLHKQLASCKIK